MKKRILAFLLILALALSLSPCSFAATRPPAGVVDPPQEHVHTWGDWVVLTEPTCTETGARSISCTSCGYRVSETMPTLPHSFGEWTVLREASNHSAGLREHRCTVCGLTEQESFKPEGTLERGDRGKPVLALQQLLVEQGYLDPRDTDGIYGQKTEDAVKQFQEDNGLEPDGVAWPETQEHLEHDFGDWTVVREPTETDPGLQQRVCERCGFTESAPIGKLLRVGDEGEDVEKLQERLGELGYGSGTPDGQYGNATAQAVIQFQVDNGLPPTGIVTPELWDLLFPEESEDDGRDAARERAAAAYPAPPDDAAEQRRDEDRPGPYPRPNPNDSATAPGDGTYPPNDTTGNSLIPPVTGGDENWGYDGNVGQPEIGGDVYLVKSCVTPMMDIDGFEEGDHITYGISLENMSNQALVNVTIYDCRSNTPLRENEKVGAYSGLWTEFEYTVTEDDAERGYIENYATAYWEGEEDGKTGGTSSNTVNVPTKVSRNSDISIEKYVLNPTAPYFTENDTIQFGILVTNTGDTVISEAIVYDILKVSEENSGEIASIENFMPHDTREYTISYTVDSNDVETGWVENTAWVSGVSETGDQVYAESSVTCATGERIRSLPFAEIRIEEVGGPDNGYFYVLNEKIEFLVTLSNTGDVPITMGEVSYDSWSWYYMLDSAVSNLLPAQSLPYTVYHTVTQDDVDHMTVTAFAESDCIFADNSYVYLIDTETVPTGINTVSDPIFLPGSGDSCVRRMNSRTDLGTEASLNFCTEHGAVYKQTEELLADPASAQGEAWAEACELWRTAVSAEYEDLGKMGNESFTALVTQAEHSYFQWIENYREELLRRGRSETAADRLICEQLQDQCVFLCYLTHNPPAARPDSYLAASYEGAGGEPADRCTREWTAEEKNVLVSDSLCAEHALNEKELNAALKAEGASAQPIFETAKRQWLSALSGIVSGNMAGISANRAVISAERSAFGKLLSTQENLLWVIYSGNPAIAEELVMQRVRAHVIELCADFSAYD